ncbi:hypothetical protein KY285_027216 [Solanum tuberosum]|nr:hypothetical protein KY289_027426 [Solanum tuberosum]KAH0666010.1 hypothetical protein KY285_027216 [Solanum tuberosum]
MGALKQEIRLAVKMFKPTTLSYSIQHARMHDKAIEATQKKAQIVVHHGVTIGSSASYGSRRLEG